MRLTLGQRLGREYDQGTIYDILQQVEQQVNDLADGRISARDGAATAAPTSGNYVKGDIVWNSNPAETSNAVTGESYIIIGWECTTSGAPGTWKEWRALTGAGTGYQAASPITNSLGADVALNNTANYFDGPSVAQGTSGTWFASGTVTLQDPTNALSFLVKLWDGTTVIASAGFSGAANNYTTISLSGYLASPAGNLRISVKGNAFTTGKIIFNVSGNSKDSTISAIRIG